MVYIIFEEIPGDLLDELVEFLDTKGVGRARNTVKKAPAGKYLETRDPEANDRLLAALEEFARPRCKKKLSLKEILGESDGE
ncbi:MAG: hypothetical protein ACFFD4_31100 [Candidatus Odinarchaeota archaeon]